MADNAQVGRLKETKVGFAGTAPKAVKRIYCAAFEKKERMNFTLMRLMAKLPPSEFFAYSDGTEPEGLIYMATLLRLTFVMFFAVDESKRNKGLGGRILNSVRARHPKNTIVVSIELPNSDSEEKNALAVRRRGFYLRNGFMPTGYSVKLAGIEQELLVCGGKFSKPAFIAFFAVYSLFAVIPRVKKLPESAG